MTIRAGIIVAEYNSDITSVLAIDAKHALITNGVSGSNIYEIRVPGAAEVPLMSQQLARSGKVDLLVVLAAVVYGETDHYRYICEQVSRGCQRVMLDESIPIGFGVLTVRCREHALVRADGSKGNLGADAAKAALVMLRHVNSLVS